MRWRELQSEKNSPEFDRDTDVPTENADGFWTRIGNASEISKYIFDRIFAVLALIFFFPLMLSLSGLLLVCQGRPIFIAHHRVGRNGVMFPCLKFRTMVVNGDEVLRRHLAAHPQCRTEWETTRKLRFDPRVTPAGAVLRKTSLDEIPQLWNVIRGHMSLVGPRPIVASEAELYGVHFNAYKKVRPGLTGLWQVSGRSETTYSERVQLDVQYVAKQSFGGDVAIILKTLPVILRTRGSF